MRQLWQSTRIRPEALEIEIEPTNDGTARVLSIKGGEAAGWPERLKALAL